MELKELLLSHGFEILIFEEKYILATYNKGLELIVKNEKWEIYDLEDNCYFQKGNNLESLFSFIENFFR